MRLVLGLDEYAGLFSLVGNLFPDRLLAASLLYCARLGFAY